MRIEIEIPKEFEEHFRDDKFKNSLERIMEDIKASLKNGDCLCAGRYEYETIEMLIKAFENSRQAYDIDGIIEKLEKLKSADPCKGIKCSECENCEDCFQSNLIDKAIEIVKQCGKKIKAVK